MHLTTGKVLKIMAEVDQAGANWNLKLLAYHICGILKHFWVQDWCLKEIATWKDKNLEKWEKSQNMHLITVLKIMAEVAEGSSDAFINRKLKQIWFVLVLIMN